VERFEYIGTAMSFDIYRNDIAVKFDVYSEAILDQMKDSIIIEHVGAQQSAEGNTVLEEGGNNSTPEKIT
jgi:hypothetical protein